MIRKLLAATAFVGLCGLVVYCDCSTSDLVETTPLETRPAATTSSRSCGTAETASRSHQPSPLSSRPKLPSSSRERVRESPPSKPVATSVGIGDPGERPVIRAETPYSWIDDLRMPVHKQARADLEDLLRVHSLTDAQVGSVIICTDQLCAHTLTKEYDPDDPDDARPLTPGRLPKGVTCPSIREFIKETDDRIGSEIRRLRRATCPIERVHD